MDLGELLTHKENLEAVLDSLTDAIIAHDVDRRITVFNQAAERLTGLRRDQVVGRDCHDVMEGGFCGTRCAFGGCCAPEFDLETFPMAVTDTAGRTHHVETTVVPVRGREGEVVGVVAAARDVTELDQLRKTLLRGRSYRGIIGKHPRMQSVYELIRQVAPTDVPVLIQGESGTGKELCALAVHAESERRDGPFIAINCGALPEGLLESELFGHVKGAFTGATRDKKGRFELAHGGTLFLDEVGELSQSTQVKLLRVIQEMRFERVGGERPIDVDVRIISATNRELREMARKGQFREDLFFRLAVIPIEMPPLRRRGTDLLLIADHLLSEFAAERGLEQPLALSEAATKVLLGYRWPGNVRELMNALQYAMVKTVGGVIEPKHLPPEVVKSGEPRPQSKAGRKRKLTPEQVREALAQAEGSRIEAAKILGVGRSTLYRYLEEMGE
jgi:PAS domain S-box-containing protein